MLVRGEVIVIARPQIAYDQIASLAAERGGIVVGFLEVANTYQLYFAEAITETGLNEIREWLANHDFIINAGVNEVSISEEPAPSTSRGVNPLIDPYTGMIYIHETFSFELAVHVMMLYAYNRQDIGTVIPNDPRWENLWGMMAINAPRAWYFNELMDNVSVGVIDYMFGYHEDLEITFFENNLPETEARNFLTSN